MDVDNIIENISKPTKRPKTEKHGEINPEGSNAANGQENQEMDDHRDYENGNYDGAEYQFEEDNGINDDQNGDLNE